MALTPSNFCNSRTKRKLLSPLKKLLSIKNKQAYFVLLSVCIIFVPKQRQGL
ncbi:hypothetical protein HMPREF2531_04466 [Bacteroides intestinalis]|uniref:Uncharacterized protein n=1 Tax=Bacteroides intestinalis TaxID=329854 RepID=A0A139KUD9_9BACE|nr:hypothetical protein HMPREF2531_04466 [Bacteroides intestinalis]